MAAPVASPTLKGPQSVQHTVSEPSTPSAAQHSATSTSLLPPQPGCEFLWTPSKSEALGPAAVKLTKREPRLWERAPHLPAAQDSRFKTVWKRHMLRPRAATSAPALPSNLMPALLGSQERTPERPVKKMRVQHDLFMGNEVVDHAIVTKWQRRRSSLPRKEASIISPAVDVMPLALAADNIPAYIAESGRRSSLPPSFGAIQHSRSLSEPLITLQDISCSPPSENLIVENKGSHIADQALERVTNVQSNDHGAGDVDLQQCVDDHPGETAPDLGAPEDLLGMDAIPTAREDSCIERDLSPTTPMDSEETGPLQLPYSTPTKCSTLIAISPEPTRGLALDVGTGETPPPSANESPAECHPASTAQAEADSASSVSSDCDDESTPLRATENRVLPEHAPEESGSLAMDVAPLTGSPVRMDITEDGLQITMQPAEQLSPLETDQPLSPASSPIGTPTKFPSESEIDPPTPILEDATATLTITTMNQLEDDKAFLRSFLDRAAASKVVKVPIATEESGDKSNCTRRESLQNRRDSDAVRQALASPRQPLEQKDGNLFSPPATSKQEDIPPKSSEPSIADGLILPPIEELLKKPERTSPRRSGRTRTARSTVAAPTKERTQISVRLNEGNDTINLTKSEAQVTAIVTRRNTRKNKGAALSVPDRLVKYRADIEVLGKDGTTPDPKDPSAKTKRVEWTATICYLDQTTGKQGVEPLVDGSSNPDDEIHPPDSVPAIPPSRSTRTTRSSTPKYRKLRSLGTAAVSSTPAKATLSSMLAPDELAEDATAPPDVPRPAAEQQQTKRAADAAGPSSAAPSVTASKTRSQQQSRIPHSRKRLSLNPSVRSVAAAVREDTLRLFGPGGAAGAAAAVAAAAKVQVQAPASLLSVAGKTAVRKAARKGDVQT